MCIKLIKTFEVLLISENKDNWDSFLEVYPQKFEKRFGELKEYQITAVENLLECSNENCGNSYVVPFSCKSEICPSCSERQVLEFSDWLTNEVLFDVKHKHTVLTMPMEVRGYFQKAPLSETRIVDYNRTTGRVTIKFKRKDFDDKHKGYSTETITALELIARLIQHIHYPKMHYKS